MIGIGQEIQRLLTKPPTLLYEKPKPQGRRRGAGGAARSWTKEEQEVLHDLLQAGKSVNETVELGVAALDGRNKESVRRMAYQIRRNGIDVKAMRIPWTASEDKILLDMKSQKLTYTEIGKALKRSKIAVQNRFFNLKQLVNRL